MLLRLLRMLMEGDATRLRAPYVDTLSPPICPSVVVPRRVVDVLVGGDMLCCHPPSGILTGPLYEEGLDIPP